MAWSMSSASSPRTSPTTMRSGRIRRELMTSCRWRMAPLPSTLGGRVSSRATCSWCSCSSAASSMVTMRSRSEMKPESTLSSVVLPAPVPPLMSMFSARGRSARGTRASAASATESPPDPPPCSRSAGKRRMESSGPSTASGGMMALTREPSGRRASTIGELSSTRRPTRADDAIDHAHQVPVVLERRRQPFELAAAARRRPACRC